MKGNNKAWGAIFFYVFVCINSSASDSDAFLDDLFNNGPCSVYDSFSNCELIQRSFSGSSLKKESEGKRILILDTPMAPRSSFTLDKDIALGYYFKDENKLSKRPVFSRERIYFSIPKKLELITESISRSEKRETYVEKYATGLFKLFKKTNSTPDSSVHGDAIYEILKRHNNKSQFLFTSFPEISDSYLCNLSYFEEELESFYFDASTEISELIKKFDINYVNISYAWHFERKRDQIIEACHSLTSDEVIERFLKVRSLMLKKLALENPNVLFIKALPNDYSYRKSYFDESINCDFPVNVIKVGYVSTLKVFKEKGEYSWHFPDQQWFNLGCADIFINGGIDQRRASSFPPNIDWEKLKEGEKWWRRGSLFLNKDGIYSYPSREMSTSYATAVATSFVNWLQKNKNLKSAIEIKKYLNKKTFDPVFHGQFFK